MVLSSFNNYLGFNDKILPEKSFIVASDYKIDGNFLLHHFVSYYIKNNACISILGLAQTITHYTNAGQKLGINLQNLKNPNQFHVFDGLKLLFDGFVNDEESMFSDPTERSFCLKKLWNMLKTRADEIANEQHLVVIDDITALLNIGISVQAVMDFIHYCKVLTTKYNVTLVVLCHSNDEDDDYTAVLTTLQQYSTLHIHVNALKTGYSRDLSGELRITHLNGFPNTPKLLHFKLLDKDVRFFAPGTSNAVL